MEGNSVLTFWFEETPAKNHFNADPAFDAKIREHFEDIAIDNAAIAAKSIHPWESKPETALALIITLDQFPRNMYRATPAAFAWDPIALTIAKRMIENGYDLKIPQDKRSFVYIPFTHSENISDQIRGVELVDQRSDNESTLFHARAHMKVIQQFGRFPYRNKVLGRKTTPAEKRYLDDGGYVP